MDDDDSQDEQINRSTSRSKGNRAALWVISDDSDDDEESEEAESGSGEEEEEDHLDGEENDDEDGDEEEEECKAENGAFEGTSAEFVEMSSDEDGERCPICLNSFSSQLVATPETCEHYFCLDCILEWAKNANSCPVDRITFSSIYLRKCFGGKVQKMITVQKPVKEGEEDVVDFELDQTNCEVCGASDREDRLLLCDGCDSGYHMECLTPPLDAVPVEEWFCPECEANNHHSRSRAEEVSETQSVARPARPAMSHSQSHAARQRRAIARTQQSERVRANVNRHRITQARSSQLAPTYLMRSTWLDETINAVVAGLNTAAYVRNLTPRVASRRCKAGKRRRVKSKKTFSAKGKKGKAASAGVKKRKRKARRTKSRQKLVVKKSATPRSRIASSLGIVKSNTGSSLPTVYRPSEHTLSSMRADIGAASLSVYGDPFDLDPFVEREEEEQRDHVSSLLEAKRRGISRSALRSHQPVARPVAASLSRGLDVTHSGTVVEAAPVPDLLGSILSGQNMLLMDSSDVIINRDGSLKVTKPMSLSPSLNPVCGKSSNTHISPQISSSLEGFSASLSNHRDLPGSSYRPLNEPIPQNSPHLPPLTPSLANHTVPSFDLQPRHHLNDQPPGPNRLNLSLGHQGTSGVGALNKYPRETTSSSVHPNPEHCSRNKGATPSEPQPKKAPPKPMWVDVSVLPRIPKIKRESNSVTNDGTHESNCSGSSRIAKGSSSNDTNRTDGYGMLETGMNSLSGGKGKQQSVDQQQGRGGGQAQRHRSDGAGSSSAFSNSFTSSSSITNQPRFSSFSSSSSSAVSFRINSSGNSWHSRRLSTASATVPGCSVQLSCNKKEDEARKRQLHRDKQMLLASHTVASKQQERHNVYDPFNPTASDSSSSDDEAENNNLGRNSQHATPEADAPGLGNEDDFRQIQQDLYHFETETQESKVLQEMLGRPCTPEAEELSCSDESVKDETETIPIDTTIDTQTSLFVSKCKEEPGETFTGEIEGCGQSAQNSLNSDMESPLPIHPSPLLLKTEKESFEEEIVQNVELLNSASPKTQNDSTSFNSTVSSSATCTSAPTKKKEKAKIKSDSKSCSRSPSRDLSCRKQNPKKSLLSKERRSSSSETDRGKSGSLHALGHDGRRRGRNRDGEGRSWRERSRERRRRKRKEERSSSDSSRSSSSDRTHRKRRHSRSRSKERKRSRSASSSSSRERLRRKKHRRRSVERNERDHERGRVSKDKRRHWSRSKSRSKSRSRSRSRERRKDHARKQQSSSSSRDKVDSRSKDKRRYRSRSRSRERRKEGSSKSSQNISQSRFSFSKDTKGIKDKNRENNTQMSVKDGKVARLKKQVIPTCTSFSKVKAEDKDSKANTEAPTAKMVKEQKVVEVKKEKRPSFDMFEDCSSFRSIKKEELNTPSFIVGKRINEEGNEKDQCDSIKTETVKMEAVNREVVKMEAVNREVVKMEAVNREVVKMEVVKMEAVNREVVKMEAVNREVVKMEAVNREVVEMEAFNREVVEIEAIETEAVEIEAIETEAVEMEAVETEAFETQAFKTEAFETRAFEKEAFETRAFEKEAFETRAFEKEAVETEAFEKEAVETEAFETEAVETEAFETEAVETEAFETETVETEAFETETVETRVFETEAFETWAFETEAVETEDIETRPFETEAVKTETVETRAAEMEAVENRSVKPKVIESEVLKNEAVKNEVIESEAIKPEAIEITITKSELSSPELYRLTPNDTSFSTVTTLHSPPTDPPVTAGSLQESDCQPYPVSLTSSEPPNAAVFDISMKQEVQQPTDSDDDFNVDVMLDNLDFVKSESAESSTSPKQEKEREGGKNKGEQIMVTVGAKSKTPVKRVTWNIQEPEGPQPEKSVSKLALYKLKLKQEGARKSSFTTQTSIQDVTETVSGSDSSKKGGVDAQSASDGVHRDAVSTTGQAEAEGGDSSRKDQYLKKLHMQERAVEEVKLAIKPFYQKRDINKDEYKEILRKAVQKVCHSKSGEINPVKVGNLVKAYVDKYRHARKHKKDGAGKAQEQKSSESP